VHHGAERSTGTRLGCPVVSEDPTPLPAAPDACPACGAVPGPEERFCRRCGTPLSTTGSARSATPPREVLAVDGSHVCPSCGTRNPAARELCGRCGADLETGELPPHPASTTWQIETGELPPAPRRWWLPVLAVAVVVAAIVGVFALLGLGPFAASTALSAAPFDASGYPPSEVLALPLSDVATLTTRQAEEQRSFTPAQMVDQDPQTAWHAEGAELPPGAQETIDLFLEQPSWVAQLVIDNGDQADGGAFESTARIKRARVTVDGGRSVVVRLLDLGRQSQIVELPRPELTTTVRLEVLETFPGVVRDGVAITELALRGWVADVSDADLAEERAGLGPAAGAVLVSKP
jgi:ribosomal protein L40E